MDSRTRERVERWDSRPFTGGTDGLSDLAARDFSGAVHANDAWLFVLNGRAVGTVGGELEDVVADDGRVYEAPDPALPLLAAMEANGGEPKATYYTNETPLSEVDRTLRDGFTGYVELSENVLSGDYYLVYYGGRRMAVAYIGNAERLVTDDEAFDRAADEVGIYEVIDVDVDVTDLDELVESEPSATADPARTPPAADEIDDEGDEPAIDEEADEDDEPPSDGDETGPDDDGALELADESGERADPRSEAVEGEKTEVDEDDPVDDGTADRRTETDGPLVDRPERPIERIETLEDRCERLVQRREELLEERDRLRSRVDELEAELDRVRSADADDASDRTALSARRALEGTNLFVRYNSRGQATLESAYAGEAAASDVRANLQLDHHTTFDESTAVVDGDAYEAFLPTTMAYRTVDWLVNTLVYEIRDTGRTDDLADLYDAIPRIDRVEFHASISLADDDTADVPDEVGFDVVAYDRLGNPLVVAVLHDSREPVGRESLEELEAAASAVKANYPELAAALSVTSSFFGPGAHELVEQATSVGFLSRGSKLSYVNLSRKRGYHLCLVEARSDDFHVAVPEL